MRILAITTPSHRLPNTSCPMTIGCPTLQLLNPSAEFWKNLMGITHDFKWWRRIWHSNQGWSISVGEDDFQAFYTAVILGEILREAREQLLSGESENSIRSARRAFPHIIRISSADIVPYRIRAVILSIHRINLIRYITVSTPIKSE